MRSLKSKRRDYESVMSSIISSIFLMFAINQTKIKVFGKISFCLGRFCMFRHGGISRSKTTGNDPLRCVIIYSKSCCKCRPDLIREVDKEQSRIWLRPEFLYVICQAIRVVMHGEPENSLTVNLSYFFYRS